MESEPRDPAVPSMVIFIDPETQQASYDFRPQNLSPEQYGMVLSGICMHLAKLFHETNTDKSEKQIIDMIMAGITAGLAQGVNTMVPTKPH